MFLFQYFCLHGILPFSKSYPEIESLWSTAKYRGRKSFDTWYYVILHILRDIFIKIESNYFFSKTYSEIGSTWSINSSNEEIVLSRVKNYLCNVSREFLIKIESTCRRQIKEQISQLTLLHYGRTVRSSHRRCSIRKLFLKISQYPQKKPVLVSIF